ncbi:MAG: PP2C family protein-serine/threonine phosphatase, partial [Candidatus Zixiibacteriota bacterium]
MVVLHRKLAPISIITNTLKNVRYDDINIDIPLKSRNEFGYLAETLHVMGHKLSTAQKDFIEKERINRELEIARDIQANILPSSYPRHAKYNFSGTYRSAKLVGGDYYDFIDYGDHHLAFLVADVSGKSLPGMLVMLLTRDIVKKYSLQVRRPDELLCEVNRELLPSIKKGMFVTMFFGLLDKRTGLFKYASAGHNPLVKIDGRSGKAELMKTKGFPLGMVTPEKFNERIECAEIKLGPNDWLIQYTDGINEAVNSEGEEFGMQRFVSLLEETRAKDTTDLITKVIAEYELFTSNSEQFDDITLLAMKWTGDSDDRENNKMRDLSNVSQN